jgi:hypothetical protein
MLFGGNTGGVTTRMVNVPQVITFEVQERVEKTTGAKSTKADSGTITGVKWRQVGTQRACQIYTLVLRQSQGVG